MVVFDAGLVERGWDVPLGQQSQYVVQQRLPGRDVGRVGVPTFSSSMPKSTEHADVGVREEQQALRLL